MYTILNPTFVKKYFVTPIKIEFFRPLKNKKILQVIVKLNSTGGGGLWRPLLWSQGIHILYIQTKSDCHIIVETAFYSSLQFNLNFTHSVHCQLVELKLLHILAW